MDTSYSLAFEYGLLDDDQLEHHELVDPAQAPVVRNELDLHDWREARADAFFTTAVGESLTSKARQLLGHMMRGYDGRDGGGMSRSPRKLSKALTEKLGKGFSEKTVRRLLDELVEKGACWKEPRKDPRGTGKRVTTNAYHVRDELLPEGLRCVTPLGWSTPTEPLGWSNESRPLGWSNPKPTLRLVKPPLTNLEVLPSGVQIEQDLKEALARLTEEELAALRPPEREEDVPAW